ncbi:MAG: hypothetical protein HFE85_03670, partial [Clostridiales bacterium]|nr:hypothetical protein [Clostridiales bacterium]
AQKVGNELKGQRTGLVFRLIFTLLPLLGLLYVNAAPLIAPYLTIELPLVQQLVQNDLLTYSVNLGGLLIAMAACFPAVVSGIASIFTRHACGDVAPAVVSVTAAGHTVMLMAMNGSQQIQGMFSLALPAVLFLFVNTLGKRRMVSRVRKNFAFIREQGEKSTIVMMPPGGLMNELGCGIVGEPAVAAPVRAKFLSGFLHRSYQDDSCERIGRVLTLVLILAALLASGFLWFTSGSVPRAVSAFVVILTISLPAAGGFCGNLLFSRAAKRMLSHGAMLSGNAAVEKLGDANGIVLQSGDLFPQGSIILNGIKTYQGEGIDHAILSAAALLCNERGPLASVFDEVIARQRDILPKLESSECEYGMGYSGWVEGQRVFVGTRELMQKHHIDVPTLDYEARYKKNDRQLIYLAVAGELAAMFIITYVFSGEIGQELRRLQKHKIHLFVSCSDPNVTAETLVHGFDLNPDRVTILSVRSCHICDDVLAHHVKPDASAAYDGRCESLSRLLCACARMRGNLQFAGAALTVSSLLGFAVSAFLCLYGGIALNPVRALIYQSFWTLFLWIVPSLRKP